MGKKIPKYQFMKESSLQPIALQGSNFDFYLVVVVGCA